MSGNGGDNGRVRQLALAAVLTQLAACSVAPPKNVGEIGQTHVEDDWKPSALWLYATPTVAGGPAAECGHVREVIAAEEHCQGASCRRGAELASEWLDKCKKHAPAEVAAIKAARDKLRDNAGAAPSKCAREHERIANGCDKPACREQAQRWATHCAEETNSPLALAILEHAVERSSDDGEHVRLDARSCPTLRARLAAGSRCADEEKCKAAWNDSAPYRALCLGEGALPDMAAAVQELAIAEGAAKDEDPPGAVTEAASLPAGSMPLIFADGQGAVLRVCFKRASDLGEYRELRDGCAGGELRIARLLGKDGPNVRRGRVFLPLTTPFTTVFPALALVGEREGEDERAAAALEKSLRELGTPAGDDGIGLLVRLIDVHAAGLVRSERLRAALRKSDAALTPILARIGERKVKGAARVKDVANRHGLVQRARTRPFADLSLEGALELGARTRAFAFDATASLPEAMRAYRKALEPLEKSDARGPRLRGEDLALAGEFARDQAGACADAQKKQRAAQQLLLDCAFERGCDESHQNGIIGDWQAARAEAEAARHQLDIAASLRDQSGVLLGIAAGCAPDP